MRRLLFSLALLLPLPLLAQSAATEEELNPEYIIPNSFNEKVTPAVAAAVAKAARDTGVARL